MSTHFHIRWNDHNGDGTGHFQGKHRSEDDWDPLSECSIEPGKTYTFNFHSSTGDRYDTYITFAQGAANRERHSWSGGAKVPHGSATPMHEVEVTATTTQISFRAWKMVSDDPKVKVNWSDGNQGSTSSTSVELKWEGHGTEAGWSYKVDGEWELLSTLSDKTVPVDDPGARVSISVYDHTSTRAHRAGFYDLGSEGSAMVSREISVEALPADMSYSRPSDNALTYKAVNLFQALSQDGTLSVSSAS